jgi:glycosyltransferase involved in cell wall biosynthesis
VVVGDGPQLPALRAAYPAAIFEGARFGEELSRYYASADVLVFPSRTDTFGLVMLEALACGTPVAAFPEQGPRAVLGSSGTGCLNESLTAAVLGAMEIPRERCRAYAEQFSWTRSAETLLGGLIPCRSKPDAAMVA